MMAKNDIRYGDWIESKPLPGAVERDWTGMDFTVTMFHQNKHMTKYKKVRVIENKHADNKKKVKGQKVRVGRDGHIMIALPILKEMA